LQRRFVECGKAQQALDQFKLPASLECQAIIVKQWSGDSDLPIEIETVVRINSE
jgi:hypothetical protein